MKPRDRENKRYIQGFKNPVDHSERILFDFLYTCPRGIILDVGCGVGIHASMMASEKFRVVGIDFSTVALSKARQSGIEMVAVDVDEGLPFKANTFDYVWATDVLEHVFDPIHVVMEASRVLRNGGYLLLAVPNDLTLKRRLAVFFTGRSPQSKIYRARGQYKHHTLFSLDLLKYMLVDKGGFRLQFFYATLPGTKRALHSEMIAALFGSTFVAICSKG